MIENFIKSNIKKVTEYNFNIELEKTIVKSTANNTLKSELVLKWLTHYNTFQGIDGPIRKKISEAFLNYNNSINKSDNNIDIRYHFQNLQLVFFEISQRKWLSATSKLLWCVFPNDVVLYDSFVEKAITVLQCLDPDLASYPRISKVSKPNTEKDIYLITDYYINYQNIVKFILRKNQSLISGLKNDYGIDYDYDIRIIDRLLWLMGNPSSSFLLGNHECSKIK